MAKAITQPADVLAIANEYPNQFKRMVGYALSKRISEDSACDLANEAWLRSLETFDESKGLDRIQWAWWVFQHNVLPGYGRRKGKEKDALEGNLDDQADDDPPEAGLVHPSEEAETCVGFLSNHLPDDLGKVLHTLLSILETTESSQVYQETARRLGISIEECRNRMKRLRRACRKLKSKWERRQ